MKKALDNLLSKKLETRSLQIKVLEEYLEENEILTKLNEIIQWNNECQSEKNDSYKLKELKFPYEFQFDPIKDQTLFAVNFVDKKHSIPILKLICCHSHMRPVTMSNSKVWSIFYSKTDLDDVAHKFVNIFYIDAEDRIDLSETEMFRELMHFFSMSVSTWPE